MIDPSLKTTFPIGVEAFTPVTVAVNVTGVANNAPGLLVLRAVVLAAKLIVWRSELLLAKLLLSPAKAAVML
jgi:hypothetical protein